MQKINVIKLTKIVIGLFIMLFGRMFPAPSVIVETSDRLINMGLPQVDGGILLQITPVGWSIATIFLGLVFLWTTVDIIWPSLLSVLLVGTCGFAPMPVILSQYFGNPQTVMVFFLFMFSAALVKSNISVYIARYILTRPILKGKPWLLTITFLLTTYFVALFDQFSAVFLMLPVLYEIVTIAGYRYGDRYVTVMVVYTMSMCLLSFCTDVIKGGAFFLVSNLQSLAVSSPELGIVPFSSILYLLFAFTMSMIIIAILILMMRFVFRVDVSKLLEIDLLELQKDPLPPMSIQQKSIIFLFGVYAILLLLPGIIGRDNLIGGFINQNTFAAPMLIVFLTTFIHFDGKPIIDVQENNAAFTWGVFFLVATAFLFGGVLTNPTTNIPLFLEFTLGGLLSELSLFALAVAIVFIGFIFTNFFNSVAAGLILTPVLIIICNNFNVASGPILGSFYFIVLFGLATPAASPFAAMLFGNGDWISKRDVVVHSMITSLIVVGVLIVFGIPLSRVLL